MKSRVLAVSALLLAAILLPVESLIAQYIPSHGRCRLLIVFVRFQDDTTYVESASPSWKAWSSPDVLPPFTSTIVANEPTPPFPEASLTDYFYQQSNGRLILYGTVFPRVYVTEKEKASYLKHDGVTLELRLISREILHALNDDPTIDLSEYDADGDGYIDQVVIVLRRLWGSELPCEGSGLADIRYHSPVAEFGDSPALLKKARKNSGLYVRYDAPGIILPELDLLRLVAHELGHHLNIARTGHLASFNGTQGAPANGSSRAGYALMLGAEGASDMGGHLTLSAFERDIMDDAWIDCGVLESDARVVISDLYSTSGSNCFKLPIPFIPEHWQQRVRLSRRDWASLYLSNHQRIGFFDRLRTDYSVGRLNQHGLMTTGLLMTMGTRTRYAVIPADNTLHLSDTSAVYDGDMFGPGTKTQLTPWTRPNINGYAEYPEGSMLTDDHFQAIDNIGYSGGPDGEMVFDYIGDFRIAPVIREESWIGHESGELSFEQEFLVAENAELTISTLLTFSGTWRLEKGARVVIEVEGGIILMPGSVLEMEDESQMIVRGACTMDGTVRQEGNAELIIESETGLSLAAEDIQPLDAFTLVSYPNPTRGPTTIEVTIPEQQRARVDIVDAAGRLVATLLDADRRPGQHTLRWNADASLASGVYLIRLKAGDATRVQPLVLAR